MIIDGIPNWVTYPVIVMMGFMAFMMLYGFWMGRGEPPTQKRASSDRRDMTERRK